MADAEVERGAGQQAEEGQPQGEGLQVDWRSKYEEAVRQSRKWEGRAKAKDDEIAGMVARSELDDAVRRAEAAEAQLAEARGAEQRREWAEQAATEFGVPASVVRGSTLEEMREHARAVSRIRPAYPVVHETGTSTSPTLTKGDILAIRDPRERKAAIRDHLDLF